MRVDSALVQRLEESAASATVAIVAELQRLDPGTAAAAVALGAGALVAMGPGRYVNRAIGVTLVDLDTSDLGSIEHFFDDRGSAPAIELSAWAPRSTVALLRQRGYGPDWFRSMFAMSLDATTPRPAASICHVDEVDATTYGGWLDVLARGNEIDDVTQRSTSDEFSAASAKVAGNLDLLASIDGQIVGCGSIHVDGGVAWLGRAATLPEWRGRGIQTELLHARLRMASARGADLVAATAVPTGSSARNLQAVGFSHVQTQVVVSRDQNRMAPTT